jgi:ribose 5-phosphate isomerase B
LCHNEFTAQMSREHNNANILVLGGRVINQPTASNILRIWLETEFAQGRHARRLDKLTQVEHEICNRKFTTPK